MKLAITGCLGRMGRTLVEAVTASPALTLAAVSVQERTEAEAARALVGQGVFVTQDTRALVEAADAVIDFTVLEYSLGIAAEVAAQGKIHILGTTGFTDIQQAQLSQCAKSARIVQSGNFSIGVNVLARLVEQAAARLSEEYDIEIREMHHRHKIDAPSGTALLLGEAAAAGRGVSLKDARRHYGEGRIGAREEGTIGFSVQRGGGVIGDHEVTFAGAQEMIMLSHRSFSRGIYAQGAIKAALWAKDKPPGLYSMHDVLG